MTIPKTSRTAPLALRLAGAALAMTLLLMPAREARADISIELKGMFGIASASHDQEGSGSLDTPIFDIGGGGMVAALIDLGGIWVGLDFRYWYESHLTQAANGSGSGGVMGFNVPSAGIRGRFDFMPAITAGLWINYAFGTAWIDENRGLAGLNPEWRVQGLDAGVDVTYNYKLGGYKTYILFGIFAHYQYLTLLGEPTTTAPNPPNLISNNIGGGANLGVRFDFGI